MIAAGPDLRMQAGPGRWRAAAPATVRLKVSIRWLLQWKPTTGAPIKGSITPWPTCLAALRLPQLPIWSAMGLASSRNRSDVREAAENRHQIQRLPGPPATQIDRQQAAAAPHPRWHRFLFHAITPSTAKAREKLTRGPSARQAARIPESARRTSMPCCSGSSCSDARLVYLRQRNSIAEAPASC